MKKPSKAAGFSPPQEQYGTPAPTQMNGGMANASTQMPLSHSPGGPFTNVYDGLRQAANGDAAPYPSDLMNSQEDDEAAPSFPAYSHGNPEPPQAPSVMAQMYRWDDHEARAFYPPFPFSYHPQAQFNLPNQFARTQYNLPPSPAQLMQQQQQNVQRHEQVSHLQIPHIQQQQAALPGLANEGATAHGSALAPRQGNVNQRKGVIIDLSGDEDEDDSGDDEPLIERLSKSSKSEVRSPPIMQPKSTPKVVIPKQRIVMKLKNTSETDAASPVSAQAQPPKKGAQPVAASKNAAAKQKPAPIIKQDDHIAKEPSDCSSNSAVDEAETPGLSDQPSNDQDQDMPDAEPINWKLPEYEIMDITEDDRDFPSTKVTIPGMIREEILLKPQHPKLSVTLLRDVFIPLHQRTYPVGTRDPQPAYSILNFTTIANIVAGVYFTRKEDGFKPEDADTDEVFFSAIDNWRVGAATARERYQTIRGVQEFCDVALDVVFWIKEHGLGDEGGPRKRRERSDKGVKRGPRGPRKKKEEGEGEGEGEGGAAAGGGNAGQERKKKGEGKKSSGGGPKAAHVLTPKRAPKAKKDDAAKAGAKGPAGAGKDAKGKNANNKVQRGRIEKKTTKSG